MTILSKHFVQVKILSSANSQTKLHDKRLDSFAVRDDSYLVMERSSSDFSDVISSSGLSGGVVWPLVVSEPR